MKKRLLLILVLIIFISSCTSIEEPSLSPSRGITYYVDDDIGCDNNGPGSEAEPWCTLSKAASTLQTGDTVLVQDGTYSIYRLNPTNGGSLGSPITFKANGNNVVLDGSGQDIGFYLVNRNYITLDGFKFRNVQNPVRVWATTSVPEMRGLTFKNLYIGQGVSPGSGISVYQETNPIRDFLVDNVTFIDAGGIQTYNTQNGIIKNSVFDCTDSAGGGGCFVDIRSSQDMLIENNQFFFITSHTVQIGHSSMADGCNNVIVKNNLFYRIHDVKIDAGNNNVNVLHNTFVLEKPTGGSTINNPEVYPSTDITVKDNLFVESGWIRIPFSRITESDYNYWVGAWPTPETIIIYENLLLEDWQAENGYIHDMNSNQDRFLDRYDIFVDPDNFDFTPREDSWLCQEGNEGSDGETRGAISCGDPPIQECYEGTLYGECSETQPWYCTEGGTFEPNCQECLCADGFTCRYDGFCVESKKSRKAIAMPLFSNIKSFLDLF
ncbi:MAG: right-handed parallel beta-helix repeat-containing protein [Nanoarchaeota archaeon]